MTLPYVYKWTQLSTGKWYIGSRTAKTCHPDDGYICSSRIVKPMIVSDPEDWDRSIIATGEVYEMLELETKLLTESDAKHNQESFNQHNGDGNFKFKGGVPQTDEHKLKLGLDKKGRLAWNKGQQMTPEYCEKHAAGHKGKPRPKQTPESNELRSLKLKGRIPWNKGKTSNNVTYVDKGTR